MYVVCVFFFFQAEDGIRDLVRSRGLGDVYKRQGPLETPWVERTMSSFGRRREKSNPVPPPLLWISACLLYTSDAADDLLCVDLGGRRIIKKKKNKH